MTSHMLRAGIGTAVAGGLPRVHPATLLAHVAPEAAHYGIRLILIGVVVLAVAVVAMSCGHLDNASRRSPGPPVALRFRGQAGALRPYAWTGAIRVVTSTRELPVPPCGDGLRGSGGS